MTKFCETIVKYMDCPCEVFENESDYGKIHERYLELLETGKREGFTPLIIAVDGMMADRFEENGGAEIDLEKVKNRRISDIEKSERLSAADILSECDYEPEIGEYDPESVPDGEQGFATLFEFGSGILKEIVIAKIPTSKPWELAIYAPMGGFNECPMPEEQAAVFKYWYEKYGAYPAVVARDTWEMYVEKPVEDEKTAMALAAEMYNFCFDIVDQGTNTLGVLAGALTGAKVWYFWWD